MTEQLRADARRNREKILRAASELFALEGPDLCVDDIARRAGVGHATVFRRFPTKDDLVLAMFEERLRELAELAEAAADHEDPWEGLVGLMTAMGERHTCDRGLTEALGTEVFGSPRLAEHRLRIVEPVGRLLRRAQEAGQVRADLEPPDVLFLISAVAKSQPCHFEIPDLWRRYLGVILDGMRPGAASSPLEPPAPTMEAVERALGAAAERAAAAEPAS